MYGLGWNHAQQRVEDLKIPRRTCIHASTGLLQHPVVETWQTATSSSTHQLQAERRGKRISQSTNLHCLEGTLAQDQVTLALPSSKSVSLDRKLFRIVRQVDGVIDMQVHGFHNHTSLEKLELRLATKLTSNATYTRVKEGQGRLQDDQSRVTVLTSPQSVQVAAKQNVLIISQILFPSRLRIISEDVDTFHRGADKAENHFGTVMIADFSYPVEVFHPQPTKALQSSSNVNKQTNKNWKTQQPA